MRPKTMDEIVGQRHLLGEGKLLRRMIEADRLGSIILYGPPGTGKTTIASVIANATKSRFERVNATTSSKSELKDVVERARDTGEPTILFIDEIHRFNKAQQDYLLPHVEDGTVTLIGATTENPFFEVNGALISRSRIFELEPVTPDDVMACMKRAIADKERGYGDRPIEVDESALNYLAHACDGDVRQALSTLELAAETTPIGPDMLVHVTTAEIMECSQTRIMRYDREGDNHYDLISALIESMRHSDPDAAMYYMTRMMDSGEDPKYVARRLVVFASEDIGMADPQVLDTCVSAHLVVERVGMPECMYALAHATMACAIAPKSNAVARALGRSHEIVAKTGNLPVPKFLQDESYEGAARLGRGGVTDVYQTPANYDGLECLPKALLGTTLVELNDPVAAEQGARRYLDWYRGMRETWRSQNVLPTMP